MINRRQFVLGLAAMPIAVSNGSLSAGEPALPNRRDIFTMVEDERVRAGIPALGAALVSSVGMEAIGVAGVRAYPDGPTVSQRDRWHIGSCTKAFTATLAARLVDRGALQWDSTIGQVFGTESDARWRDIPLLWLLCHRSGAGKNFEQVLMEQMVARGGSLRDQRSFVVAQGLKSPPAFPPNSRTEYSNAGFLIAGAMMERVVGSSWESLVRREVFEPLGLESAGFGAPGAPGRLDEPLGHVRGVEGRWKRIERGPGDDIPAAGGPAGTIHLSLPDWSLFVAEHLRGAKRASSYLSSSSWKRLHQPAERGWDYAPGWIVTQSQGGSEDVLHHLGSNNFFVAQATLHPARDIAILLVTNLGDDAAEPAFRRLHDRLESSHS